MSFNLESIDDLRSAPYNPRHIGEHELRGLKHSMKLFGDISGIVWNKASGHLVCGHQRVRALKDEYGDRLKMSFDSGAPMLTADNKAWPVRVVEWDDQMEMAANIAANSQAISGAFTKDVEQLIEEVQFAHPDWLDSLRFDQIMPALNEAIEQEAQKAKDASAAVPEMELLPYEHYDYVLVLCRNVMDWEWLCEKLKLHRVNSSPIEGKKKVGLGRAVDVRVLMELLGEKRGE